MTAREQLIRAEEMGHSLKVITRGPWPEHGDPHPKYFAGCSCGWEGKGAARSQKGVNFYLARHLGTVIADGLEAADDARVAAKKAARDPGLVT